MIARRTFLTGLIAAPLVAHAESLMQIRGVVLQPYPITWRNEGFDNLFDAINKVREHVVKEQTEVLYDNIRAAIEFPIYDPRPRRTVPSLTGYETIIIHRGVHAGDNLDLVVAGDRINYARAFDASSRLIHYGMGV